MRIPRPKTPFDDVQYIDPHKRHVRVPFPLLYSRHHSATAVVLYGLIDNMAGKWGPVESGRSWLAWRVGLETVHGLAKVIRSLSVEHTGEGMVADSPVYLQSKQRGHGTTAIRQTVAGIPPVILPEWTLGDSTYGLLVDARAWRLYAILMDKRVPGKGTVAMKTKELAQLARCRADSLPDMIRSLEAARMVVKQERPGKATVYLPVTVKLGESEYAEVTKRLTVFCGVVDKPDEPCGEPVDGSGDSCGEPGEPHPSEGTAPHPSEGTAPHPSTGIAYIRVLTDQDPSDLDPVVGRAAPSGRTHRPKNQADVVGSSSPSATADNVEPIRPPSWKSLLDQLQVVPVDTDRKARTRALIEETRAAAQAVRQTTAA